jgi:DNA repair exonuclease SbcCD nuclease subunit
MRLIHTADWQIGMKAAHLGAAGTRVREARLQSARAVAALAAEHSARLMLVAGDTFEHNAVDRRLVEEVAAILDSAACPVYVIPGNHDPLETGSVWEHAIWESLRNVRIARAAEPIDLGDTILYPCPIATRWSNQDPAAWIPRDLAPGRIHIGLAHGTLAGLPESDRCHPIAAWHGLDYMALGHWHSTAIRGRWAYAGTPEPSRFGERDSGSALLVDLTAGSEPAITPVRTAQFDWLAIDGTLREAIRAVETVADPGATLVDCRVTGFLAAEDRPLLERLDRVLAGGFVFARLDTAALVPAPDDDEWVAQLPPGYLREAAARLRGRGDQTAAQALLELYGMLPR